MYTIENYNTYDIRIKLCGFWKLLSDNYTYNPLTNEPHFVITNIKRNKYEEIYHQIQTK